MRRLLILIAALGFLSACSVAQTLSGTADMSTMAKSAYAARTAYAIALTAANQYAALPRCGQPTSPPACSSQPVVDAMRKADVAADAATLNAEQAVRTLGQSPTVVAAIVQAAQTSVSTLETINATYGGK